MSVNGGLKQNKRLGILAIIFGSLLLLGGTVTLLYVAMTPLDWNHLVDMVLATESLFFGVLSICAGLESRT